VITPEHRAVPHLVPRFFRRGSVRGLRWIGSFLLVSAFACLPLTASRPVFAADQKPYALIFGTVFTADGHLAFGVPVKVRRADKKKPLLELQSDHSGEFAFRVPPGPADYIVWLDIKAPKGKPQVKDPVGVTSQTQAGVELKVHVEGDERVDISLHLPESLKSY
jgi:hypothetical protein